MSRLTRTARVAGAAVLAFAGLLGAGCSAGQTAQTATQKSTVEGAAGNVGPIAVRYARVAYPDRGRYSVGDQASLLFDVVNTGRTADALVSVRSGTATDTQLVATTIVPIPNASLATSGPSTGPSTGVGAPRAGAIPIPPGTLVTVGTVGTGCCRVTLVGLTRTLLPGQNVSVTFVFARAGALTLTVPVATPLTALPRPSPIVTDTPEG
ncbi:MAG TPA: copper chaperone PCu(A)C [Mycobacteriales bacterium]|nr:copper chaperone PCu(A)C [Mycobacteriales bacterium]